MKKLYVALFGVCINTAVWAEDAAPVSFPDLDATYLKTGDFVNVADLQKVAFEQNKEQVRCPVLKSVDSFTTNKPPHF